MTKRLTSVLFLTLLITLSAGFKQSDAQGLVERVEAVCGNLPQRSSDIRESMQKRSLELSEAMDKAEKRILEIKKLADEKIIEVRQKNEKLRFDAYKKMRHNAASDKDKLAVEAFVSSAEKAVHERQAGYNTALENFYVELESGLNDSSSKLQASADEFTGRVNAVLLGAEEGCSAGRNLAEVRQDFIAGLKNARLEFSGRARLSESIDIKKAAARRDKELNNIRSEFEQKMQTLMAEYESSISG